MSRPEIFAWIGDRPDVISEARALGLIARHKQDAWRLTRKGAGQLPRPAGSRKGRRRTMATPAEILAALCTIAPASLHRINTELHTSGSNLMPRLHHLQELDLVLADENRLWDLTYQGRRALRRGDPIPDMPRPVTAQDDILRILRRASPLTSRQLAEETDRAHSAIRSALLELVNEGRLCRKSEPFREGSRGRLSYLYRLAPTDTTKAQLWATLEGASA